MKYLRLFETTAAYDAAKDNLDLPNVSYCEDNNEVHYNPWVEPETRVVATFNVTSTSDTTKILNQPRYFNIIEIDGIEQPSVESYYKFSTIGEHTIKYTLIESSSMGTYAFSNCKCLTNITIPDSVISIGDNTFYNCTGLTNVTIGSGVTSIGSSAFQNCSSLTDITIPDSVISIGNNIFESCTSITSITIGDGVTSIGNDVFYGCTSLTNVRMGSSVTNIGKLIFQNCTSLTSIICNATTAPTIAYETFKNIKYNGTLTVPSGSTGYDGWMNTGFYYLGYYNWTKVEQ